MVVDRATLKSYFELGDYPTAEQFANLIDSMFNLAEDNTATAPLRLISAVNPNTWLELGAGAADTLQLRREDGIQGFDGAGTLISQSESGGTLSLYGDLGIDMGGAGPLSATMTAFNMNQGDFFVQDGYLIMNQGSRTLKFNMGSGPAIGIETLVGGNVVVSNTEIANGDLILMSHVNLSGTPGILSANTRVPGVSFTIHSSSATDASNVIWFMIKQV